MGAVELDDGETGLPDLGVLLHQPVSTRVMEAAKKSFFLMAVLLREAGLEGQPLRKNKKKNSSYEH